tara:strand:+ start:476 stop:694 length:219 start_codon:yes stop_codon:yes gene_type:complete
MISLVIGKGLLFRKAPRSSSAVICVSQGDYMVNVYCGAGLNCVETYGGIRFVAFEVKVRAAIEILGGSGCSH